MNIRLVPLTLENPEFTEFILKMRLDDTNYDFYQADADLESVEKWISKNIANKDDYFIILNDEKMVGYCALYNYNLERNPQCSVSYYMVKMHAEKASAQRQLNNW